MWKKNAPQPSSLAPDTSPSAPASERRAATPKPQQLATIGPSITIRGNLSGDEALRIEGRVEGEVSVRQHTVTIGPSGRVEADVHAKSVRVEGEVKGNVYGEDEISIRASGKVEGNLQAPRVTLDNGAKFRGNIDMEPRKGQPGGKPTPKDAPARAS